MAQQNILELFFTKKYPFLTAEDVETLQNMAGSKELKTGDIYIQMDSPHRHFGVIGKGLVRGYYLQTDGTEVTIQFAREGEIAGSHELMFYNKPSKQIVQALEPTQIFEFQYDHILKLAEINPRIERLRYTVFEEIAVKLIRRLETFLLYSPLERYQWLLEQRIDLIQRVPQKYLASFLGITPVSLSRLRNRWRNEGINA